ncbi:MAG: 2OG-Fe(II) oxygenase [Woeseiaceae bacterium]
MKAHILVMPTPAVKEKPMKDKPSAKPAHSRGESTAFYDERNTRTRIDVFAELTPTALAALRQFFRRLGAAHYVDEVLLPTLELGEAQIFCSVRDRPWPPWGLSGRTVSSVCEIHSVGPESWAISPIFMAEEDATNIGLACALYKEVLQSLAVSKTAEVCYLAAEGSLLADYVLRATGFHRDEDVVLTERARYLTYRALAADLLGHLGLDGMSIPDLLAQDFSDDVLTRNALFHQTIQLAARAALISEYVTPEIIWLDRGGHASKPGGVPGGTGIHRGTDQFGLPGEYLPYVSLSSFLGSVRTSILEQVLSRERMFAPATVHPEGSDRRVVDDRMRRALTLENAEFLGSEFTDGLKGALPGALKRLGMKGFAVGDIEVQVTASGDGDYYRMHRDSDNTSTRELSFVYFFHREPRRFSGGELRLFDNRRVSGTAHADSSQLLSPRQDTLVIFPSRFPHELLPVRVPSKEFGDSRFTVNGWIHQAK